MYAWLYGSSTLTLSLKLGEAAESNICQLIQHLVPIGVDCPHVNTLDRRLSWHTSHPAARHTWQLWKGEDKETARKYTMDRSLLRSNSTYTHIR